MEIKIFSLWTTYWLFSVSTYTDEENLSEGEVEHFNFKAGVKGDRWPDIGYQLVEPCREGFDRIWRHIGFGYYKCTSKTKE